MEFSKVKWFVEHEIEKYGYPLSTHKRVKKLMQVVKEGDLVKTLRKKGEPIYEVYKYDRENQLIYVAEPDDDDKSKNALVVDPSHWGLFPIDH